MLKSFFIVSIISLLSFSTVYADDYNPPYLSGSERLHVSTYLQRSLKKLSSTSIDVEREILADGNIFTITKKGQGHIEQYIDASWVIKARLRDNNGLLETLESSCHIKSRDEKTLVVYKKIYDYDRKTIQWEMYDNAGELKKRVDFPLKGKTCDDTTLIFFLKTFLPDKGQGEQFFYLLTNEPKLFKTKLRLIETETLDLPFGATVANKFKLTADIGILDDVLDRFMPKTYVWYSKGPPYAWLKYQGFEKDSGSHYILSVLNKKEP